MLVAASPEVVEFFQGKSLPKVRLGTVTLEAVTKYKYLGFWIGRQWQAVAGRTGIIRRIKNYAFSIEASFELERNSRHLLSVLNVLLSLPFSQNLMAS